MPSIINSDSGATSGSAGLKFTGNNDGILEIQNDGITSLVVSNQYIKVPVGNTASRPETAAPGMIRFNSLSGRFEVYNGVIWANASPPPIFEIEYLVVGGGGGGGAGGGGGGGGGYRIGIQNLTAGNLYTTTIGSGGSGAPQQNQGSATIRGANGSISVFSDITSAGGGGGASTENRNGLSGGSGGGGATDFSSAGTGGSGNTPPTSPSQGNNGGNANAPIGGGGGGGAGAAGSVGAGGRGANSSITGSVVTYAGGGGAAGDSGGSGGGGTGVGNPAGAGTQNLGGGGGGGGFNPISPFFRIAGGSGGSGVVILKYADTLTISNPNGGLTFTTDSANVAGYKITTFTAGTGSIRWT
jgi:hypothetical protein